MDKNMDKAGDNSEELESNESDLKIPQETPEERERLKIARFSQYVLSPEAWFRSANELEGAMKLLEPQIECFWKSLGIAAGVVVEKKNDEPRPEHSLINVHMMLAGFAIENLCKGYLARRLSPKQREKVKAGDLPKRLNTHEILKLVKRTKMKLSCAEEDLVERIHKTIRWRGRYPSPTSYEEIVAFSQRDSDIGKIKMLLQKLRAHVGAKDSYRIQDPNVLAVAPWVDH
jgi:hypothetical protein